MRRRSRNTRRSSDCTKKSCRRRGSWPAPRSLSRGRSRLYRRRRRRSAIWAERVRLVSLLISAFADHLRNQIPSPRAPKDSSSSSTFSKKDLPPSSKPPHHQRKAHRRPKPNHGLLGQRSSTGQRQPRWMLCLLYRGKVQVGLRARMSLSLSCRRIWRGRASRRMLW